MSKNEGILSFCFSFLSNKEDGNNITESVSSVKVENFEEKFLNTKHNLELRESNVWGPKLVDLFIVKSEDASQEKLEKLRESDAKNFKCSYDSCGKSFDYKWILDRHINSHFCFKLFKCDFENCDKAYKSKENLNLHFKNKHLGEKPYQCRFCISRFSHRNGKTYHERKVHINYLPHQCTNKECNISFASKSALKYHISNQH